MAITTRRYTRTYELGGVPARFGWVTFQPIGQTTDGASLTVPAGTITANVRPSDGKLIGPDGGVGVLLECNDDPSTTPTGGAWQITEHIQGGVFSWKMVASTADAATCDLASKPQTQINLGAIWLSPAQAATLEAAAVTAQTAAAQAQTAAAGIAASLATNQGIMAQAETGLLGEIAQAQTSLGGLVSGLTGQTTVIAGQVASAQAAQAAAVTAAGQAASSAAQAAASAANAVATTAGTIPADGAYTTPSLRTIGQNPQQAAPAGAYYLFDQLASMSKTGASDATAALNAALAGVPSGSTVLGSTGATYMINGDLVPPHDHVTLDFRRATLVAGTARTGDNLNGDRHIFLSGRTGVKIRNLVIPAPLSAPNITEFGSAALMMVSCTDCAIEDCELTGHSIQDNAGTDNRVERNVIAGGGIGGLSPIGTKIRWNKITNAPGDGTGDAINLVGYAGAPVLRAVVQGNQIRNCNRCGYEEYANGDQAAAVGSLVADNYFENCVNQAISVVGTGTIVRGNRLRNNIWGIEATGTGQLVQGNRLWWDAPTPGAIGISINDSFSGVSTTVTTDTVLPVATSVPLTTTNGIQNNEGTATFPNQGVAVAFTGAATGSLTGVTGGGVTAVPAPAAPTLAAATGGTLAAATYAYRLTECSSGGETTPGPETTVAISGTNNAVTVTGVLSKATNHLRVYGRTAGGEQLLATLAAGATTWTDLGSVAPSGALPTSNTSNQVKVTAGSPVLTQRASEGNICTDNFVQNHGLGIEAVQADTPQTPVNISDNTIIDTGQAITANSSVGGGVIANNIIRYTLPLFDATGAPIERRAIQATAGGKVVEGNHVTYDATAAYPASYNVPLERPLIVWGAGNVVRGNIVSSAMGQSYSYSMQCGDFFTPAFSAGIVEGNIFSGGVVWNDTGTGNRRANNQGPVTGSAGPAIAALAAMGTGAGAYLGTGAADEAGGVSLICQGTPTAGPLCTIQFTAAMAEAPLAVNIEPGNALAVGIGLFVSSISATGFTVSSVTAPQPYNGTGDDYFFNYDVRRAV